MFQHACKMGWKGSFRSAWIALSVGPVGGLAKVQESGCTGGEA